MSAAEQPLGATCRARAHHSGRADVVQIIVDGQSSVTTLPAK
jgi:hypothetical protein